MKQTINDILFELSRIKYQVLDNYTDIMVSGIYYKAYGHSDITEAYYQIDKIMTKLRQLPTEVNNETNN